MTTHYEKRAAWLAADPTRESLLKFLDRASMKQPGGFAHAMVNAYRDWGCLTERQEAAVRRMMAGGRAFG